MGIHLVIEYTDVVGALQVLGVFPLQLPHIPLITASPLYATTIFLIYFGSKLVNKVNQKVNRVNTKVNKVNRGCSPCSLSCSPGSLFGSLSNAFYVVQLMGAHGSGGNCSYYNYLFYQSSLPLPFMLPLYFYLYFLQISYRYNSSSLLCYHYNCNYK